MVSYDFQYYNPWISMDNTNDFKRDAPGSSSTNINVTTCPYGYETVRAHINGGNSGTYTATWFWPNGVQFFTYSVSESGSPGTVWARFWVGTAVAEINQTGTYRVHLSGPGVNHDIHFTISGTVAGVTFSTAEFRKFSPPIPHTYTYQQHWDASTSSFPSKNYDIVPMPEDYDTFCFYWLLMKGVTSYDIYVYWIIKDANGNTVHQMTWSVLASYTGGWSYEWFAHSEAQLNGGLGTFTMFSRIYRPDTNQTLGEYNNTFTVYSSDPSDYRMNIPSDRRVNITNGTKLHIE